MGCVVKAFNLKSTACNTLFGARATRTQFSFIMGLACQIKGNRKIRVYFKGCSFLIIGLRLFSLLQGSPLPRLVCYWRAEVNTGAACLCSLAARVQEPMQGCSMCSYCLIILQLKTMAFVSKPWTSPAFITCFWFLIWYFCPWLQILDCTLVIGFGLKHYTGLGVL